MFASRRKANALQTMSDIVEHAMAIFHLWVKEQRQKYEEEIRKKLGQWHWDKITQKQKCNLPLENQAHKIKPDDMTHYFQSYLQYLIEFESYLKEYRTFLDKLLQSETITMEQSMKESDNYDRESAYFMEESVYFEAIMALHDTNPCEIGEMMMMMPGCDE